MKTLFSVVGFALLYVIFALSSCATQQESKTSSAKPAATAEAKPQQPAEKAPAKAEAKAETKGEKKAEAKAETKGEKKAEAKAETKGEEAKAKAEKVKGDVGLLDTDKNYLILVTKEGKLITLDFDQKTKATMLEEKPAKMSDVGLGSAADVEYVTKGEKKIVTKMEFKAAKGE
jgi:membrane protein involved in colicin uptake